MSGRRHIALLLAGGQGARMNMGLPKQFARVDGETVLQHAMRAFQRHPLVNDIYVVCPRGWDAETRREAEEGGVTKFRAAAEGGATAFESLRSGVRALSRAGVESGAVVMVHDAARPLVTQDIISRNIAVCLTRGNAITALPLHEALALSADGREARDYLPREGALRAQTPHTFPLGDLLRMMDEAKRRGVREAQSLFTLANELGERPLHLAQGDMVNFKITAPRDILVYQALKALED